jgi:hypothetical protein
METNDKRCTYYRSQFCNPEACGRMRNICKMNVAIQTINFLSLYKIMYDFSKENLNDGYNEGFLK